jgi:hypothetical protein
MTEQRSLSDILRLSARTAVGSGLSGALAMGVQVTGLMWLRTTMNYQYRNGGTTLEAMRALYAEDGLARFYQVHCSRSEGASLVHRR